MRHKSVRVLSLAGAALLLAGCGASSSSDTGGGAAARTHVGDISQDELIAQIQAFQSEVGLPINQPAPGLARSTLERMLQDKLIKAKADELGLSATQADIDKGVATLTQQNGGAQGLADAAHSSGLAVTAVPDLVRSNVLVALIGDKLASGADNTTAVMAVQQAVIDLAARADVRVAPRYGVWQNDTLSISNTSTVTQASPSTEPTPAPPEAGTPAPEPTDAPSPSPSE